MEARQCDVTENLVLKLCMSGNLTSNLFAMNVKNFKDQAESTVLVSCEVEFPWTTFFTSLGDKAGADPGGRGSGWGN